MLHISKDKKYTNIPIKPSDIRDVKTVYLSSPPKTQGGHEEYHGIYFKFYSENPRLNPYDYEGIAVNIGETLVINNRQFTLNSMDRYNRVKYKTDVENFILLEQL